MKNFFSLKTLLWTDAIAGFTAGCILLLLKKPLSNIFQLPQNFLLMQSLISLSYAAYSFSLAQQRPVSRKAFIILITANALYAASGIIFLLVFGSSASSWGIAYLSAECLFIATLAFLEWRRLQSFNK